MSRMQYSEIQTRIDDITNITTKDNLRNDAIQWTLDLISSSYNWKHLEQEASIALIAPYTTGTASITNGSKAVTGSGTTFTAAMVGRKIRFNGENAYYRIASFSSTTSITLDVNYQGDTDTDATLSIFKDEYRLPANLNKLKVMRQIDEGVAMTGLTSSAFDILEPTPTAEGSPGFNIIAGSSRDTYTTGTVTVTVGSATITGTNTAWTSVDGLGKGNRIKIGTQQYTVKSVDSDTQITIFETVLATATGTTYELLMDNMIIQVFSLPDKQQNLYFRYQRNAEVLFNNTDIPDLPDEYHWLLVDGGVSRMWELKDQAEARLKKGDFLTALGLMKANLGSISTNVRHPKNSIIGKMLKPAQPRHTSDRGFSVKL